MIDNRLTMLSEGIDLNEVFIFGLTLGFLSANYVAIILDTGNILIDLCSEVMSTDIILLIDLQVPDLKKVGSASSCSSSS